MAKKLNLAEMAWPEVEAAVGEGAAAIIPVGAIEPHGRHAPVGTDPFIAAEIAQRLASRTNSIVFPYLPIGPMDVLYEFLEYPGTISIDARIVTDLVVNIGTELARNGFKRMVLVNGHGPNAAPLTLAAFRIYRESGAQVGILDWWSAAPDAVRAIKGFTYGTHGDEIETSLVMATRWGESVDLSAAVVNPPELTDLDPLEKALYLKKIIFTRRMDERYVGTSGNMGDPSKATRESGDKILEATVAVGEQLLEVLGMQQRLAGKRKP